MQRGQGRRTIGTHSAKLQPQGLPFVRGDTMRRFILIALAALTLAACDQYAAVESMAPKPERATAERYLEDVRLGRHKEIMDAFNPAYRPANMLDILKQMMGSFPKGQPQSIHVISFGSGAFNGVQATYLNIQYAYADGAVVGNILLEPKGKGFELDGIHTQRLSQSVAQANDFTLKGKSPIHYLFLFCAFAFPIISIGTAIAVWRTRLARPRWLWMIFVLLGFVKFTLNWTTGYIEIAPISFVLLSAGFFKPILGPVMIFLGLPVGAILFWLLLPRWRRKAQATTVDTFGPSQDMRSGFDDSRF